MTLRVLLAGNAPWAGSGYGTQLNLIGHTLRDLGAQVAYVANWGLQGGVIEWEGFTVYPPGFTHWADDILDMHARRFQADVMVTLMDVWPLLPNIGYRGFHWIPLIPVDSTPVSQANLDRLPSAFQVGAISRWGQEQLKAAGVESVYLPHGLNPAHYYPDPADRGDLKERLGFPRDCFLVGMVAANKGWPSRKCFDEAFDGFAQFAANRPEARLYVHSLDGTMAGGPNLREMAMSYGIADRTVFVTRYFIAIGVAPDDMRRTYSAMDVLLMPSAGEGFGVPTIEAQACGVPVILSDFSAQTELCGAGWLVKPARKVWQPSGSFMVEPSISGIVEALEAARASGDNLRAQAAAFGARYAQPRLQERYWKPWLADLERRVLGPAMGAVRAARGGPVVESPVADAESEAA